MPPAVGVPVDGDPDLAGLGLLVALLVAAALLVLGGVVFPRAFLGLTLGVLGLVALLLALVAVASLGLTLLLLLGLGRR